MSLRTRLARWKRAWQSAEQKAQAALSKFRRASKYSTGPVDPKHVQPPSGD